MNCPHCDSRLEYVICVSAYFQNQLLNSSGALSDEWEDVNDAIGDTLYHSCPFCFATIVFDNGGILVKGE